MTVILEGMAKRATKADEGGKGTETVRIDSDLAKMLTVISIREGKTVGALLSPQIRSWVEKKYREVVRAMHDEIEPNG